MLKTWYKCGCECYFEVLGVMSSVEVQIYIYLDVSGLCLGFAIKMYFLIVLRSCEMFIVVINMYLITMV